MNQSWGAPKFTRLNSILDLIKQLRDLEIEEAKKKIKRLEIVLAAKKLGTTDTTRSTGDR